MPPRKILIDDVLLFVGVATTPVELISVLLQFADKIYVIVFQFQRNVGSDAILFSFHRRKIESKTEARNCPILIRSGPLLEVAMAKRLSAKALSEIGLVKAANLAYYEALSARDLNAMERVWSCAQTTF